MGRRQFEFFIETKADLIKTVKVYGFVPLFRNSIPGFSVEEHVSPRAWFDGGEDGVWEWKGPVIRECGCAYGKFFDNKAVFISRDWFADFANYRRNGYDFETRFDDGMASYQDRDLFVLLQEHAPVLSRKLKTIGKYRKDGQKGFDTVINRLQAQGYAVISNFVYETDRYGKPYGWGVAEYSTPEIFMGRDFTDNVYKREPEESYERILAHMKALLPETEEAAIRKLLK